jgi:hypothetical protein
MQPQPSRSAPVLITIINLTVPPYLPGFSPCKGRYSHVTLDIAGRHEWQQQNWWLKVTVRGWKFHLEVT